MISYIRQYICVCVFLAQAKPLHLELWNLVTMLHRGQPKNGFEEFSKKLFWGKFGGIKICMLAELKNSFFQRTENRIIRNIQIGHFSLKPLITPFGECGGTGGQMLKIHQIEKFFF